MRPTNRARFAARTADACSVTHAGAHTERATTSSRTDDLCGAHNIPAGAAGSARRSFAAEAAMR